MEENRDKGEIKKTKGGENVAAKKTEKKKEKKEKSVVLVLVIHAWTIFFFLK